MFKKIILLLVTSVTSLAYADCGISDALKNKQCSTDYFVAKNVRRFVR